MYFMYFMYFTVMHAALFAMSSRDSSAGLKAADIQATMKACKERVPSCLLQVRLLHSAYNLCGCFAEARCLVAQLCNCNENKYGLTS